MPCGGSGVASAAEPRQWSSGQVRKHLHPTSGVQACGAPGAPLHARPINPGAPRVLQALLYAWAAGSPSYFSTQLKAWHFFWPLVLMMRTREGAVVPQLSHACACAAGSAPRPPARVRQRSTWRQLPAMTASDRADAVRMYMHALICSLAGRAPAPAEQGFITGQGACTCGALRSYFNAVLHDAWYCIAKNACRCVQPL